MHWKSLNPEEWANLQPYVDTALLPVVHIDGTDWANALSRCARLATWADRVEQLLAGRLVRFPLLTLYGAATLDEAVAALKATFVHVVVLTDTAPFERPGIRVLSTNGQEGDVAARVAEEIVALWNQQERENPHND